LQQVTSSLSAALPVLIAEKEMSPLSVCVLCERAEAAQQFLLQVEEEVEARKRCMYSHTGGEPRHHSNLETQTQTIVIFETTHPFHWTSINFVGVQRAPS